MNIKKIITYILAGITLICSTTPVLYWMCHSDLTGMQVLSDMWVVLFVGLISGIITFNLEWEEKY